MEIDELRKRRRWLEEEIATSVSKLITEFQHSTGIGIRRVSIDTMEVTNHAAEGGEWIVARAEVDLDL